MGCATWHCEGCGWGPWCVLVFEAGDDVHMCIMCTLSMRFLNLACVFPFLDWMLLAGVEVKAQVIGRTSEAEKLWVMLCEAQQKCSSRERLAICFGYRLLLPPLMCCTHRAFRQRLLLE